MCVKEYILCITPVCVPEWSSCDITENVIGCFQWWPWNNINDDTAVSDHVQLFLKIHTWENISFQIHA